MKRTLNEMVDKYCSKFGTEYVGTTYLLCRERIVQKTPPGELYKWYIENYPDRVEFLDDLNLDDRIEFFKMLSMME